MDNERNYIRFSEEEMSLYIGEGRYEKFFWDLELYDASFNVDKSNGFGTSIVKIIPQKGSQFIAGKCKLKYNGAFRGEEFIFIEGTTLALDNYDIIFLANSPKKRIINIISPPSVVKDDVRITFIKGQPSYDLYVELNDEGQIEVKSTSDNDFEVYFAVEYEQQRKLVRVFQKLENVPSTPFIENEQRVVSVDVNDDESKKCIEMSVF